MNIINRLTALREEDYETYLDIMDGVRDICIWAIALYAAYKVIIEVAAMVA